MKKLKKFFVIIRVSFSDAVTYKASLISRFTFYTLIIYIFMSLWRAIYKEGSVNGYSYTQIVWYLIMTEFVGFASDSEIFRTMNDEVKSGSIAYQISRPIHYVFYLFFNSLGKTTLSIISFGSLAAVLGFVFVGPLTTFRIEGLSALIISVLLGIILNFFFCMLIGLTSFYIEDNYAVFLIYQKATFMLGMFLPVEFLPVWLQGVAKNLPFSYINWAPASIFVNFTPETALILISKQLMWIAVIIFLTLFSYHIGVRRLVVNGG